MTEKQAEKLQLKIKKIRAALAADKKRWGGFYDDSRGMRYMPPQYYIKLADWKGGLRYLNWFYKNFPDDGGFPDFLFELAIILFKSGKVNDAGKMIFEAYTSNIYIIDKYFERPIVPVKKYEHSNLGLPEYLEEFCYRSNDPDFEDFAVWLNNFTSEEKFAEASEKFVNILRLLQNEKTKRREQF